MITVAVVDAEGRPVRAPGLARWLARVAPARAAGSVTIALVSDARMRALNLEYRKKNYPTDVLSFPEARERLPVRLRPSALLGARGAPPPRARARRRGFAALPSGASRGPQALGDIVIATGVAKRQARTYAHPLTVELRILALHGLLHLLGYDHETDNGQMAELERRLRRKGGLNQGLTERSRPSRGRGGAPT